MNLRDLDRAARSAPTEQSGYLRRQAEFCLRVSQACANGPVAEDLALMAAEFHARALTHEFASV